MVDRVTIPKSEGLSTRPGWNRSASGSVSVVCPGGHIHGLDHTIDEAGNVDPSLQCTQCDWHEFVRLLDWAEK